MKTITSDILRENVFRLLRVLKNCEKNWQIADLLGWSSQQVSQKIMPKAKSRRELDSHDLVHIADKLQVYPAIFFWNISEFTDDETLLAWVDTTTWFINQPAEDRKIMLQLGIQSFKAIRTEINQKSRVSK